MDEPSRFHARNVQTLAMGVQREIERRILTGELAAGERLSESALAESMGVSRGPVREALRGLKQAGLVDLIANKGVVVRKIGVDEVLDLYDLRATIFGLACETLAKRRTDAQQVALEANFRQMDSAYAAGDRDLYYKLNVQFHAAIVEFCGNRRARTTYEDIVKEMHLFRRRGLSDVPNIEASLGEHRDIVAAIGAGDGKAARRAGRRHVLSGKKRFIGTLDEPAEPTAEAGPERQRRA